MRDWKIRPSRMPRFKSLQTTDYQDELDSLGEDSDEAFGEGAGVTGEEQGSSNIDKSSSDHPFSPW